MSNLGGHNFSLLVAFENLSRVQVFDPVCFMVAPVITRFGRFVSVVACAREDFYETYKLWDDDVS